MLHNSFPPQGWLCQVPDQPLLHSIPGGYPSTGTASLYAQVLQHGSEIGADWHMPWDRAGWTSQHWFLKVVGDLKKWTNERVWNQCSFIKPLQRIRSHSFTIYQTPQVTKRNQILCCDWLHEQARCVQHLHVTSYDMLNWNVISVQNILISIYYPVLCILLQCDPIFNIARGEIFLQDFIF